MAALPVIVSAVVIMAHDLDRVAVERMHRLRRQTLGGMFSDGGVNAKNTFD